MQSKVRPVVICGGNGSRLWPASRPTYPKQFISLLGDRSLLQATLNRLRHITDEKPMMVANFWHRFLIKHQMEEIGLRDFELVLELEGRNTAPAIALAAFTMRGDKGDPILLVLPSDHFIGDAEALAAAVEKGAELADAGYLVTFGIKPERAETGYGYIKTGAPIGGSSTGLAIERFIEKPNVATAREYVRSPDYLWNSGMFMFRASRYLEELQKFRPDIYAAVEKSVRLGQWDQEAFLCDGASFLETPEDSIDYAVMEKTERAAVIPLSADWTDVGSWQAVWEVLPQDNNGNALQGDAFVLDSTDCLVQSQSRAVALLGVQDLVVVETRDAVLITSRHQAQRVKDMVQLLKDQKRGEATEHRLVHRPWGTYDSLDNGPRFQVKHIVVNPGATLSLQKHHHRAEHWIVVRGTAEVTCDDKSFILTENQSTYIPLGATHRLSNPGKIPLEVIEVQSGTYLGEDDIVRFKDSYGRIPLEKVL
ncbi:MAG: manC [Moraxellaceae bacterium]|jgi:mannose-1-phosphate guanylyltransferase/mannose-6-phosphate isomerase|nr:manC [Moraxellaceae bacterium]